MTQLIFLRIRVLSALAVALLTSNGANSQICRGNIQTGCTTPNAVCSPVDIGHGNSGRCRSRGPRGEAECNCVAVPPTPPPPPPGPKLQGPDASVNINDSAQDGGFFTSVSSNGMTAGSAVIWAVGRVQGADHHVTLFAYDAGSLRPLLGPAGMVAGFWNNTGGNSYVVPTVANGRVYVASDKRVQIFGLINGSGGPAAAESPPLATSAVGEPRWVQYWGTVRSRDANNLVIELRSGRLLEVSIPAALNGAQLAFAHPGAAALVSGIVDKSGNVVADSVTRAKGQSLWGADIE